MLWLKMVPASMFEPTSGEIGEAAPVSIVSFVLIIAASPPAIAAFVA
jgi:hypothetical protein